MVTALADPTPRTRLLDRCLVAAYDAGLDPLLVLTRPTCRSPDELLATYSALDVPHVVTRRDGDLTELLGRLRAGSRCSSGTPAWASPPW